MKIETQDWIAKLLIGVGVATELKPSLPDSKPPAPAPAGSYYLRAVRKKIKTQSGLEVIALSICPVGTSNPISTLHCVSGQPGKQNFREGPDSISGSMEPLPQGAYSIGEVEFKGGVGNFQAVWNEGLGPVWIDITPKFKTDRVALGLHVDGGAIGTAGCLAVQTMADLKVLVWWMEKYKPTELVCDWELTSPKKPVVDVVKSSPNVSERTAKISQIVIHNTDCNYPIALATLMNPAEEVSAHLLIDRDGKTTQLVPFEKKAWHAVQANSRSIGIECVAWKEAPGFTPELEAKLVAWCRYLMQTYGITAQDIIMHREVVSTDCPSWLFPQDSDFAAWKKKWFPV